jgi:hypothetical protein
VILERYAQPPSWLRIHFTPAACYGILLTLCRSDGLLVKRQPLARPKGHEGAEKDRSADRQGVGPCSVELVGV